MTRNFQTRIRIERPAREAFAAFTDRAQVTTWLAEGTEIDLSNGVYALWGASIPDAPEGNDGRMDPLAVEEPRKISLRWRLRDEPTTATISFDDADGGTLVTFEHNGLPDSDWAWAASFWNTTAQNLRAWLERGIAGPRFDFRASGSGDVEESVEIDAPAGEVFRAIVDPRQVERWMMTDNATIEPRVGGVYDIGWEQDGPVKIVDLEPDRKLEYSWRSSYVGYETLVTWELAESAGKTRLTLIHSGFAPADDPNAYRSGWHNFLVQIKYLVEQGDAWRPVEWKVGTREEGVGIR